MTKLDITQRNIISTAQLSGRRRIAASPSPTMEGGEAAEQERVPLSAVVSECINRWFEETLKEAKTGDINMQLLVGQMYYCGYGIPRDANKGRIWITRASRVRSWAWKVSNKRPGYNASDSDSDDS